jgi:hypothetical protein
VNVRYEERAETRPEKMLHGLGLGIAIITQVGAFNAAIDDDKSNALYNGMSLNSKRSTYASRSTGAALLML